MQELKAFADDLWNKWDSTPVAYEESAINYMSKQITKDSAYMTMTKYRADGLSHETWD